MLSIYSEFPLLGFEKQDESDPTSISLLKANKGNNRTKHGIHSKLTIRHESDINEVVLESLMLALNICYTSPWCLHYNLLTARVSKWSWRYGKQFLILPGD